MAINYTKVNDGKGWAKGVPFNPTNATTMENGIKAACDGVDRLESVPSDLTRNGYGEQSGGKNLVNYPDITDTMSKIYNGIRIYFTEKMLNKTYTFSYYIAPTSTVRAAVDGVIGGVAYTGGVTNISGRERISVQVTPTKIGDYIVPSYSGSYGNVVVTITQAQLEEGTVATNYEPYFESNKMLTEDANEIASLKFLGWTVPREYSGARNYVDSDGKFHQRVGRIDLSSLSWTLGGMFYAEINGLKTNTTNVFLNGYENVGVGFTKITNDKQIATNATNRLLYVRNDSYNNATAFTSAMNGVFLYYELATEVVISEGNEAVDGNIVSTSTRVNITTRTGSNPFVLPKSGYVVLTNNGSANGKVNINNAFEVGGIGGGVTIPLYLKKGTSVYVNGTVSEVLFFPLN